MKMTLLIYLVIWLVLIIIFGTLVILIATDIIPSNFPCLGELACKASATESDTLIYNHATLPSST
jgi:hypothetical protein